MSDSRRGFLQRASAFALGLVALPRTLRAEEAVQEQDRWLANLKAPHRQLFDMANFGDGRPMLHVVNYMDTYNRAYNVPDSDINVVSTFYGQTTLLAANDAMWSKYRLGELVDFKDTAGQHIAANPWRNSVRAMGRDFSNASIETLQKRGVVFLVCNNALNFWVGQIATARGAERAAVDKELRANLLPGVVIVPAMVIAIEKAQRAGVAYNKQ